MSIFHKKTWVNRDAITFTELNRIEDGVLEALSKSNFVVRFGDVNITPSTEVSGKSETSEGKNTFYFYQGKTSINFSGFSTPPMVFTTPVATRPFTTTATPTNITSTGCEIYLNRHNTNSTTVFWLAIGEEN